MQYVKGPLLVLGGAGSGKTSLLAYKIAWLIREYDVEPTQIMALSTSVHNIRTLRDRVEERLGRKLPTLPILCFVEYGLQLIQQRLDTLGLQPGFSLYDRAESTATIGRLLRELRPQAAGLAGAVSEQIGFWKRNLTSPGPPTTDASEISTGAVATWIYRRYEQRLRAANAIDIDDILRKAVRLLTTDTALLTQWRERVRFLLVDECEYANACEYELMRLLAADGMALTVAADDTGTLDNQHRQSSDCLERLPVDLPDLRVVKLEHNFRSTRRIAIAANRIVAAASASADAVSYRGHGPGASVRIMHSRNEQHEAEGIAAAIAALQARSGTDYRNFAILFRYPEQAPAVERALRAHRVPYHARGIPSFFEQSEVRDLWAYLRLLCNPADDSAFLCALNTPRRDIDHATLDRLSRFAADRGRPLLESAFDPDFTQTLAPEQAHTLYAVVNLLQRTIERTDHTNPPELARSVVAELRYADWLHDTCNDAMIAAQRMNNVIRMINMLQRSARNRPGIALRSIITQLHLRAILHGDDDDIVAEGVALLTFDAARGTEFTHVYIVGFEEGILPATEDEGAIDIAAERRLGYRMITRARESVTFTIAEQRRLAGRISIRRASRFLGDLPAQDLEWVTAEPGGTFTENTLLNSATYINRSGHRAP